MILARARRRRRSALMQDSGILPVILAGVAYLGPLGDVLDFEQAHRRDAVGRAPPRGGGLPGRGGRGAARRAAQADQCRARPDARRGRRGAPRAQCPATTGRRGASSTSSATEAYRGAVALAFAWSGGTARCGRLGRPLPAAGALAAAALPPRRARRARRRRIPRPGRRGVPEAPRGVVDRGGFRPGRGRASLTAPADDRRRAVTLRRGACGGFKFSMAWDG